MKNSFVKALSIDDSVAQVSAAIPATSLFRASVQASFSAGTSAGSLTLQGSNDPAINGAPTNWSTIATQAVTAGALTLIPSTELSYTWIRVSWAPSAGTGTITANVSALGY